MGAASQFRSKETVSQIRNKRHPLALVETVLIWGQAQHWSCLRGLLPAPTVPVASPLPRFQIPRAFSSPARATPEVHCNTPQVLKLLHDSLHHLDHLLCRICLFEMLPGPKQDIRSSMVSEDKWRPETNFPSRLLVLGSRHK